MEEGRRRSRRERSRGEEKTRRSQKALYRSPSYHRGRAHFFAYRKWGRRAEVGERRRRRWYQVLRAYTHCHRLRRPPPSVFFSCPCPPLLLLLLLLFLPFAAPSRVFPSTRFSRSPWVGRSQHRPIRPSFARIPTRIPDLLRRAKLGGGRGSRT